MTRNVFRGYKQVWHLDPIVECADFDIDMGFWLFGWDTGTSLDTVVSHCDYRHSLQNSNFTAILLDISDTANCHFYSTLILYFFNFRMSSKLEF